MSIYTLIHKSTSKFWLEVTPPVPLDEIDKYWLNYNETTEARKRIIEVWEPIVLKPCSKRSIPNIRNLCDIHGGILYSGCDYVISNRAKEVFENKFPGEASYLPVSVEGTNENYWVLWINTIIDGVDLENSEVTDIAPTLKRLSKRSYKEGIDKKYGMFRLPMIYAESDQVTDKVKEVIKHYELINFDYWYKGF